MAEGPVLSLLLIKESKKGPTNVNLASKLLRILPPELGLLTFCERLSLDKNDLATLPSELVELKHLRSTNLITDI
jgi:Leucine-rich repeat (LRR) protein